MKFAKGVDHVMPIDGVNVVCKSGEVIPKKYENYFKEHKPGWIAGYESKKSPSDKILKTEDGTAKGMSPMSTITSRLNKR